MVAGTAAYGGPSKIQSLTNLLTALNKNEDCDNNFRQSEQESTLLLLWRIQTASPPARLGGIEVVVELLGNRRAPGQLGFFKKLAKNSTPLVKSKDR